MNYLIEILIPLSVFAMIFGIVYVIVTASHREKMAMIENGIHPNEKVKFSFNGLRFAFLAIFVAFGIFIGNILGAMMSSFDEEALGLVSAFFFGGIGLLLSFLVERKLKEKDNL